MDLVDSLSRDEIAIPLSACKNELTWTRLIAPYRRDDWRFTLDDLNIQYEISPTLLTNQLNGQFFFSGIDEKLEVLLVRPVVLVNKKETTAELAIMAHSGLGCSQWRVSSAMIRDDLGHSGESWRIENYMLPAFSSLVPVSRGTYERLKREGGGRSRRFARFGHKFIATRAN